MGCASDETMRLLDVCKDLDSHDIASFKYLCQDDIDLKRLDTSHETTDIFQLLSHKESLIEYVGHRLCLMDRPCLVKELGLDLEAVKSAVGDVTTSTITQYRKALFNVAQDLSMEDVIAMIQKSRDCLKNFSPAVRQIEKIGKSGKVFEFLNIIQEKKHITSNNVSFLYQLLYDINRGDLVHILDSIKGYDLNGFYPFDQCYPGKCIIINNCKFENDLLERKGSHLDADELSKTFRQLNYKIERHEDLKSHQILEVTDTLSKQDHSRYSSVVVCILSHGGPRSVYGVDGFPVPVRNLTEKFTGSNCKSLAGKPKLFFVQACQGKKEQIVQRKAAPRPAAKARNDVIAVEIDEDDTVEEVIPDESDFLLAFSTAPGCSSYRDPNNGSYFIQALCDQIQKDCIRNHLLDILTDVNKRVSKYDIPIEDDQTVKTVPSYYSSLTHKLHFFPVNTR
ncbi:caspase-3-like isoform X1 [Mytilus californianus]|uniref:caspase-3-like isoform X1 n=1 Tax=Mytilus californianus TaxID=6549 RepID=UPI00224683FF|nr:caspase-3-like isoform X1 [Mytilus californianus]XP_052081019.1 caspase-3-like isoform X1 [Mytilus californianus]XP_052081020.1 caspase-3-like isoform X1 [Mytilus californianus]XP_052081021.1 caspase-3-like isoform X1 [Mytilus californianus]